MPDSKNILVTGGAGYIGSHMVRLLLEQGYCPVVFDNLSMGHRSFVPATVRFVEGDVRSKDDLRRLFASVKFAGVMHFGALALVQESVEHPERYHENNVTGTANLVEECQRSGVRNFIFSSTCSVYGDNDGTMLSEDRPLNPKNPYGQTKLDAEKIIQQAFSSGKYVVLRYFNACGADPAGSVGEWHEPETHLIPNIFKALVNRSPLTVFGSDYPTKDGTCVRDYIDVNDICRAHLLAMDSLLANGHSGVYNLGSGQGYSVKEIISLAEQVTEIKANVVTAPRREGDPAVLVGDARKIRQDLGWTPQVVLGDSILAAWRWEMKLANSKSTSQQINRSTNVWTSKSHSLSRTKPSA